MNTCPQHSFYTRNVPSNKRYYKGAFTSPNSAKIGQAQIERTTTFASNYTPVYGNYPTNYSPQVSSRSRSVDPSLMDSFPEIMMNSLNQQRSNFATLQRQHRSLDGMELIGEYGNSEWQPSSPLNVCTTMMGGNPQQLSGPLSNPTSSSSYFWQQPFYSASSKMDAFGGPVDVQLSRNYELLKKEYENAMQKLNSTMNSIKTFWSPELKRERQIRKEESAKLANLQRQIAMGNIGGTFALEFNELKRELENRQFELVQKDETIRRLMEGNLVRDGAAGSRLAELETNCNQLESILSIRDQQIRSMEQQLTQIPFPSSESLKDRRIADLEEEVANLRALRIEGPRDFTDKSVSSHELNTFRMKLERSEVELAQKSSELTSAQTRLQSALDEIEELRKHLNVLRQNSTAKEKHAVLLQSDIEALRAKLENKNGQIEQKEKTCERLEMDLKHAKDQMSDIHETNKNLESRNNQLVARLDNLEAMLRDKDSDLERMKQTLLAQPDIQRQRQLKQQIEEADRDKARLQSLIDDIRRNAEKEKSEQLETFKVKNCELCSTIESLQKELSDRQVLLESQNEKIGDLDRQLVCLKKQYGDHLTVISEDEQLAEARKEISSLLRMVQTLEKDKSSILSQYKQLQSKFDDAYKDFPQNLSDHHREMQKIPQSSVNLKNRVEELEEALRESVSITAERELHLAQQKQLNQQLGMQLADSRRELIELRKCIKDMSNMDKDELIRCFESERRKHLEQLFHLKQEALMAAIAEKDAHIALLEQSRDRPREEIETLRHNKEKLMEKLKEENERRVQLLSSSPNIGPGIQMQSTTLIGGLPTMLAASSTAAPSQVPIIAPSADQEDDSEGIWA